MLDSLCGSKRGTLRLSSLFLYVIADLTFAGVLLFSLSEEDNSTGDLATYSLFAVLLTLTIVVVFEVLEAFGKRVFSIVFVIFGLVCAIAGISAISAVTCASLASDWMFVFGFSALFDLLVTQALVSVFKTSFKLK